MPMTRLIAFVMIPKRHGGTRALKLQEAQPLEALGSGFLPDLPGLLHVFLSHFGSQRL
jgi:hypothetical protein